jgi:predicted DNA-binding transcriptional regulator AlpA
MTVRRHPPPLSPPLETEANGRWMTIRQIAADLAVSPSTVYKWSARGVPWFPRAIRLRNGDVRVRRDWYESWLGEQESCDGNRGNGLHENGKRDARW